MSFTITITNNSNQNVVKTYNITDGQFTALKSVLPGDGGVLDWFEDAIKGKIHRCVKRLRYQYHDILINEETLPPADDDAFVTLVTAREDYVDRETFDAIAEAQVQE